MARQYTDKLATALASIAEQLAAIAEELERRAHLEATPQPKELADPLAIVTLDEAAKMLGGNKEPISRTTIQRMIRDGVLDARGAGKLRRITLASVNAYRSGEVIWSGDTRAPAPRYQTITARDGRTSQSEKGPAAGRVRLKGRTPTGKRKSK